MSGDSVCPSMVLDIHHGCSLPENCYKLFSFNGKSLRLYNVISHCDAPFVFRSDSDNLALALCQRGEGHALTQDQDFYGVPDSFFFVLEPGRSIKLSSKSDFLDILIYQFNIPALLQETFRQGAQAFDFSGLFSALPGNEQFFTVCAKQFLTYSAEKYSENNHSRITSPLEDSLLCLLAGLLSSNSVDTLPPEKPRKSTKEEYVAQAITFFENNIAKPISLDEVCAECSLSARSLQAAFKEVKHLSPLKHLQVMRLKRMRETIQRGFDVSEACARSGLSFSGRTSSLYRELFAESPSETRRLSRQRRP